MVAAGESTTSTRVANSASESTTSTHTTNSAGESTTTTRVTNSSGKSITSTHATNSAGESTMSTRVINSAGESITSTRVANSNDKKSRTVRHNKNFRTTRPTGGGKKVCVDAGHGTKSVRVASDLSTKSTYVITFGLGKKLPNLDDASESDV